MLAMAKKSTDYTHDIAYYAEDSRLTESSNGKRYNWQKLFKHYNELGRPLTEEEAEEFRIR